MVCKKAPRFVFILLVLLLLASIVPIVAYADSAYTVQPGDSLSGIASRFSVSVDAITSANSIANPNLIYAGQTLTIPNGAPAAGSDGTAPATNTDNAPASPPPPPKKQTAPPSGPGAILGTRRLLTYYGNPYAAQMGILGALDKQQLVAELKKKAAEYQALSDRPVQPAIHFIVTVAQASPGPDGMYTLRMPMSLVQEYVDLAAQNNMLIFLDIQVGRSSVQKELEPWIPLLSKEHVHLALDPEFDMWQGQVPGQQLGHMTADEINYAEKVLNDIIEKNNLSNNKILIVHQFTRSMLPDKANIQTYPRIELVTDMDGFGSQQVKLKHYQTYVRDELIKYAGIKLFYKWDSPLFTPEQVMNLDPVPDVIIYQ